MMKKALLVSFVAAAVLGMASANSAQASCRDNGTCLQKGHGVKSASARTASGTKKHAATQKKTVKQTASKAKRTTVAARKFKKVSSTASALAVAEPAPSRKQGQVVSLISSMAPSYGVPTWFALRIAKVESNYNPYARGSAGELGVFQLKCQTARGMGYSGSCSGLLDPATNVRYGLKHLSLALKASGGNLHLAASKHNGGLGRKTVVASYVNKVF
ncbi:MAG: lytic transglycosylase domain-containing protein [Hyphomicrobiales bacterium]